MTNVCLLNSLTIMGKTSNRMEPLALVGIPSCQKEEAEFAVSRSHARDSREPSKSVAEFLTVPKSHF